MNKRDIKSIILYLDIASLYNIIWGKSIVKGIKTPDSLNRFRDYQD
jgi:hypothetical protein